MRINTPHSRCCLTSGGVFVFVPSKAVIKTGEGEVDRVLRFHSLAPPLWKHIIQELLLPPTLDESGDKDPEHEW